jgi:MFS family permease
MALVALTSASLADVEPEVAGAASGLVNVSQQIGAAIGLAVLVTAFNAFLGHGQLASAAATDPSHVVHSFDAIFAVSALFSVAALLMVIFGVRGAKAEDVVLDDLTGDPIPGNQGRVLELTIAE